VLRHAFDVRFCTRETRTLLRKEQLLRGGNGCVPAEKEKEEERERERGNAASGKEWVCLKLEAVQNRILQPTLPQKPWNQEWLYGNPTERI